MAAPRSRSAARLPISPAVIYLAVGMLVGPLGIKLLDPAIAEDGSLIGAISETAVLVGLFCIALRLRAPFDWRFWQTPVRLGTITMLATVLLIAGAAHVFFNLTFFEALVLGAILAPTDPMLVSTLPLGGSDEHDEARGDLIAEGAINNALGLVILTFALGAIGLHARPPGLGWFGTEVLWGVGAGAGLGWLIGSATVRGLVRLDAERQPDFLEELLILAAAALTYGAARTLGANGFVAVLATGLALCHGGRLRTSLATRKLKPRMLALAARLEQLAAAVMVLLIGAMLAVAEPRTEMFVFALLLLLALRPLAVRLGLDRTQAHAGERRLLGWFGLRGSASLFYLVFALQAGLSAELAHELTAITLTTLVASIVLHGLSATPLPSRPLDKPG